MLTGLLASVRELRFPLTVGYSALLSLWLVFGEALTEAARRDALGRRLLSSVDSLGGTAELGLYTFVAAMLGSVLWNAGVARLVRYLSVRSGHPDWEQLIDEARDSVRRYEEYGVTTYKGQGAGRPSAFDVKHTVSSPQWGVHLNERVLERERKSAEMSFRVTLAVALVPLTIALGIEGGGWWWLSAAVILVVWLDVALLKHTTLRTVHQYQLETLGEQSRQYEEGLRDAQMQMNAAASPGGPPDELERRQARVKALQEKVNETQAEIGRIQRHADRRATKLFAFVIGDHAK